MSWKNPIMKIPAKYLSLVTACVILVAGNIAIPAEASTPSPGNYACATGLPEDDPDVPSYPVDADGVVSWGVLPCVGHVILPIGVTAIGEDAFHGSDLTSISIPNTVTSIGEQAFRSARHLEWIEIPNSVATIGPRAFLQAFKLKTVSLPNGLTEISRGLFEQAILLQSITIPDSVTSIGIEAFFAAESLSSVYFLGNAPATDTRSFADIAPFAKAFIQPDATGFQGLGALWDGLSIRHTPSTMYREWKTPLPSISNGAVVGDTIYASAFERALPRTLYQNIADYRTNIDDFPTPEEYVYRITKLPNAPTSSVDRQSIEGYEYLTADEQDSWYVGMGFDPASNYQFSWRAFMCFRADLDANNEIVVTLTRPNGFTFNYATREDGILDDELDGAHSLMFGDAFDDMEGSRAPSTRTVVGVNDVTVASKFTGEGENPAVPRALGIFELGSTCAPGQKLEALPIIDPLTQTHFTSKTLVLSNDLTLEGPDGPLVVNAIGTTIGVTGRAQFNAALWGLTTIASATAPSGDTGSGPIANSNGPIIKPTSETRSTVFSGFAGNSSKVPASMRKGITKLFSGFKKVDRVECTGYTSGLVPNRWTTLLARNRAKVACDMVKAEFPKTKVKLIVKPATGVGSTFRRVQVKVVGN
jgi:hypothetical protein